MTTKRRPGREAYITSTLDLMGSLTLASIEQIVTRAEVARRLGVRPSAVSHHFRDLGELIIAAHAHGVSTTLDGDPTAEQIRRGLNALVAGSPDALRHLAEAAAANLGHLASEQVGSTSLYLLAAVAPNDSIARAALHSEYEQYAAAYGAVYDELVASLGRSWSTGWDARLFATMLTALTDGLLLRGRWDPSCIDERAFADAALVLFEGLTHPDGVATAPPPARGRLEGDAMAGPSVFFERLGEVETLVTVATAIYESAGVDGLTLHRVADDLGRSQTAVMGVTPDQNALGRLVWTAKWFPPSYDPRVAGADWMRSAAERIVRAVRDDARLTGCFLASPPLVPPLAHVEEPRRAVDDAVARAVLDGDVDAPAPYTAWAAVYAMAEREAADHELAERICKTVWRVPLR